MATAGTWLRQLRGPSLFKSCCRRPLLLSTGEMPTQTPFWATYVQTEEQTDYHKPCSSLVFTVTARKKQTETDHNSHPFNDVYVIIQPKSKKTTIGLMPLMQFDKFCKVLVRWKGFWSFFLEVAWTWLLIVSNMFWKKWHIRKKQHCVPQLKTNICDGIGWYLLFLETNPTANTGLLEISQEFLHHLQIFFK